MRAAVLVLLAGCAVGSTHFGMVPRMNAYTNPREADPTRPLVEETNGQISPGRETIWERDPDPTPAVRPDKGAALLTAASVLMWFGGGPLLLGAYGTFDENAPFEHPADTATDVPAKTGTATDVR